MLFNSLRTLIVAAAVSLCIACAGGSPNRVDSGVTDDLAPEPVTAKPDTVSVAEYMEFLDALKEAVHDDIPRRLNKSERVQFDRTDSQLRRILSDIDSIDELSMDRKLAVFNLHEELQGVVIGDPQNYLICRREHTVGTNFRRTRCISAGDFKRQQDESRDHLQNLIGPGALPAN